MNENEKAKFKAMNSNCLGTIQQPKAPKQIVLNQFVANFKHKPCTCNE